jgi:hypothetical protein
MGARTFKTKILQFFGRKLNQQFLLALCLFCVGLTFYTVPKNIFRKSAWNYSAADGEIHRSPRSPLELIAATTVSFESLTFIPSNESFNVSSSAADKALRDMVAEGSQGILNLPGVPYIFGELKGGPKHLNASCARFPTIYDIKFSNLYWQTLQASNWTLHAMGAYLDVRKLNSHAPSIRITGTIDLIGPNITSYCQIWFDNETAPVIVKVDGYHYIWVPKWGNYKNGEWQPYLLNCNIPKTHETRIPTSVSIVEFPCSHSTINLKVVFDKPQKKEKAAICVKGMDFPKDDMSIRLVEWIELNYILGVGKIYMYQLANSPRTMKILDYYQKNGKIEVINTSLPAGIPNEPLIRHAFLKKRLNVKRQTELLPYNDCFYRNMYKYDYIAVVDIDEVFIPKKHQNWTELLKDLEAKSLKAKPTTGHSSFVFHNVYFFHNPVDQDETHFDDIPKEYTMLQHVRRTKYNYTKPGYYIKCLHNTEKILTLHNHFPRSCLGACASYHVEKDVAQMQHYKPTCFAQKKCAEEFKNNSILDTSIWKYKDELIQRVNAVVAELQLL